MTLASTTSAQTFNGSGSAGPFTITFRFLQNADIRAYRVVDGVPSLLAEGDDYSLTGAGSYSGGSLTLTEVLAAGDDLVIERWTEVTQETDIRNQAQLFPELVEDALDKSAMIAQDAAREISKTIRVPAGSSADGITEALAGTLAPSAENPFVTRVSEGPITIIASDTVSPASNGLILRAAEAEYGTAIVFYKHPSSEASTDRVAQITGHGNATGSMLDEMAFYTTKPDGSFDNKFKVLANVDTSPFILTGATGISRSSGNPIKIGEDVSGGGVSKVQFMDKVGIGGSAQYAPLEIYQNGAEVGQDAGILIEQAGTGDAVIQFALTSAQRWVVGVDNSADDEFRIASTTDLESSARLKITPAGDTTLSRNLTFSPQAAVTPAVNGQITFELTNDTTLTIRAKGSDGVVRSTALTLSP